MVIEAVTSLIILLLADLHVGNRKGLTPRYAFDSQTNVFQEWVLDEWEDDFIPKYKHPNYLVLAGDIIDGPQPKGNQELITTDVHEQVKMANQLLFPLVGKDTRVMVVGGSKYHTGNGTGFNADRYIAEVLRGSFYKSRCTLHLPEVNEHILIVHKSIKIQSELQKIKDNLYKQPNYVRPTRVVGAHKHESELYENIYHIGCFEYLTDCMEGVARYPDIGALQFEFRFDGEKVVRRIDYKIPAHVFQGMDGWEGQYLARQAYLQKVEEKKKKEVNDKLFKKFKNFPKSSLQRIVTEVRKQDERLEIDLKHLSQTIQPKPIVEIEDKSDKISKLTRRVTR
jgi:hypothetical protein